jgi:hypothetical protein
LRIWLEWVVSDGIDSVLSRAALPHPLFDEPVQDRAAHGKHLGLPVLALVGFPLDGTNARRGEVVAVV